MNSISFVDIYGCSHSDRTGSQSCHGRSFPLTKTKLFYHLWLVFYSRDRVYKLKERIPELEPECQLLRKIDQVISK